MKNRTQLLVLLQVALFWFGDVSARTVTLDMNVHPVVEGWSVHSDGGSAHVSDGILTISSPSYYEFIAPEGNIGDWITDNQIWGGSWKIETRMRVLSSESTYAPFIWIHDTDTLNIFEMGEDYIGFLYPEIERITFDTSEFHTYTLEGGRYLNNMVLVTIDHASTYAMIYNPTVLGDGSQVLMFGNGTGGTSVTQWDYFSFSVPEPPAVLLFGVALALWATVGVTRFRWKRSRI